MNKNRLLEILENGIEYGDLLIEAQKIEGEKFEKFAYGMEYLVDLYIRIKGDYDEKLIRYPRR